VQKYIARRVLLFLPSLMLASILIFGILRILPGDVALAILGQEAIEGGGGFTETQIKELREDLGLNDPLPVQYGKWVWSMVNGEFGGASIRTREDLSDIIGRRLPVTLQLALYTIVLSMVVAVPMGVFSALYQDKWPDYVLRMTAILGQSMPNFWIALLLLLFMVTVVGWSPPLGYANAWVDPWHHIQIMIWPALILAWRFSAYVTRVTRSGMLEVLAQDYVRTAKAKGLSQRLVVTRHSLPNALIPVITLGGLEVGTLLGGTVILENIFGVPGIGQGLVEAAIGRDFPVVQSLAMMLVFFMLTLNLVIDIAYSYVDPRVRYS
jgi:peptide/nickel transport system permease protein